MQKYAFFSLNYAPGLLKEMLAISGELTKDQDEVAMYLSKKYKWMLEDTLNVEFFKSFLEKFGKFGQLVAIPFVILQIAKTFLRCRCDTCIIYNISIYNGFIFIISSLFGVKKRVLILHEPYKEKILVQGLFVKLYFYMAEVVQWVPIALSTHVVLMSPNGEKIFRSRFKTYPGIVIGAHLTVPDYYAAKPPEKMRRFYSVVGRFNKIKKIDYFFDFVAWSVDKDYSHEFLVVTSSDILKELRSLPDSVRQRITVINPNQLSDSIIYDALSESKAVLLLQPVITQSGVLPFSFMSGTPVISLRNPGFSQYVINQCNGLLIDDTKDFINIQKSIDFIESNLPSLSSEARKTYLRYFHPKNVRKFLSSII
jgi:glycosyltransferase involved in cell wall biosynthesis